MQHPGQRAARVAPGGGRGAPAAAAACRALRPGGADRGGAGAVAGQSVRALASVARRHPHGQGGNPPYELA
ncbi:hypothetical protein GCN74_09505 [Janthinobacterium sp. FT14W]|nr:hypothetical protein GCN74_09505 [Janthinobacterium sp. FT14W]